MRSTVFTSLYSFDETKNNRGIYTSARINQIFFDIDSPKNLDTINALHEFCAKGDYLHAMFFTGGGFHFYIAAKADNLKNKKGAVANSQMYVADELKLRVGINGDSDIDGHPIGNIAQLVRVPGTFNLKRHKFCIPVSRGMIFSSKKSIEHLADKQKFGIYVYGNKFFDLSPFDSEPKTNQYEIDIDLGEQENIGSDKINIEAFPQCVKNFINEKFISHHSRYLFILYCKELGIPMKDTISLLRKVLDAQEFYHCVKEEKQPFFVYNRNDIVFPNCDTIKRDGLCSDNNCKGASLYN